MDMTCTNFDRHICLVCRKTINGLDNYVDHVKHGCLTRFKIMSESTVENSQVSDSNFNITNNTESLLEEQTFDSLYIEADNVVYVDCVDLSYDDNSVDTCIQSNRLCTANGTINDKGDGNSAEIMRRSSCASFSTACPPLSSAYPLLSPNQTLLLHIDNEKSDCMLENLVDQPNGLNNQSANIDECSKISKKCNAMNEKTSLECKKKATAIDIECECTECEEKSRENAVLDEFFASLGLQCHTIDEGTKIGSKHDDVARLKESISSLSDGQHLLSDVEQFNIPQNSENLDEHTNLKITTLLTEVEFSSDSESLPSDADNFLDAVDISDTSEGFGDNDNHKIKFQIGHRRQFEKLPSQKYRGKFSSMGKLAAYKRYEKDLVKPNKERKRSGESKKQPEDSYQSTSEGFGCSIANTNTPHTYDTRFKRYRPADLPCEVINERKVSSKKGGWCFINGRSDTILTSERVSLKQDDDDFSTDDENIVERQAENSLSCDTCKRSFVTSGMFSRHCASSRHLKNVAKSKLASENAKKKKVPTATLR